MANTILVVDGDPVGRGLTEVMLRRFGYGVRLAGSEPEALAILGEGIGAPVDLVVLGLACNEALAVLARLRSAGNGAPVIVQATPASVDVVMPMMRAGASDFVVKPVGAERLAVSIRNALERRAVEIEIGRLGRRSSGALALRDLPCRSPDMTRAVRLAERAARSNVAVLFEGEPGVGKEVLARAVQGSGERRGKPFVAVHCGSADPDRLESLLFGHEKGAVADAPDRELGKFVEASGGTLFLDAVGELPPDLQGKLLRAIQDGEVEPIGGRRSVRVDVRLMAATAVPLLELVKAGRFREDLYYRLNVFPITVPPLRARGEDVPDLVRSLLARIAAEEGGRVRSVTAEAQALIGRYGWPGNVRQLENALFRAVALSDGNELTVADFPQIAARVDGFDVRIPPAPAFAQAAPIRETLRVEVRDPHAMALVDEAGEIRKLGDMEAEIIRFALRHHRGRMSEVSRRLGIGRSTLYRKLKELGLEHGSDEAA